MRLGSSGAVTRATAAAVALLFAGAASLSAASLVGAGATLPAPLYQRWIEGFLANRPHDEIRYAAVGSGEGLQRLVDGQVDFAGSDVCELPPGSTPENFLCLPTVVGAVVPIFNVRGVSEDLRLTPEALAAIYLGKVTQWNDPLIRASNHGVTLPKQDITVIYRSDSSGTSYAWSDYLSKVNADWKQSAGVGTKLKWPVGRGAEGNGGVAAAVENTPGAIGYVELIYAVRRHLGIAMVRNAAGHFLRADLETIAAAGDNAEAGFSAGAKHATLTNPASEKAYPIATFSWLLVPRHGVGSEKRELLIQFLQWALNSGQQQAAALGYVAVPDAIIEQERKVLATLE
ncbi:MAG: phosphate ABC transporter substrate-binding protein PstS [Bryobacteraceae bacterium]